MNYILRYKTHIIAVFSCAMFLFILYVMRDSESSAETDDFLQLDSIDENNVDKQPAKKDDVIMVDVKGAVENPGVYKMNQQDRIKEAIEKAGGFSKKAQKSDVNLAQRVQDEMDILVTEERGEGSEGRERA